MLKMVHVLFEGMRKHRIEDPLTYSTLGISISSECCLSKLLLADWMWQRCAYTWWCLGVVPEDDPYGKKKYMKEIWCCTFSVQLSYMHKSVSG